MRFQRGQAFETMMLVISVIVALAILAVLMNIIGGIGGIGQGDPASLMHDQLKSIVSSGYGCSAPSKAVIKRGTTIYAQQIRGDIVSINLDTDKLLFESAITGLTGAAEATFGSTTNKLSATSGMSSPQAQIIFTVCGNTGSSPQLFKVCVASTETDKKITDCAPPSS